MKKVLLFGTAILVATSVLAFGGHGGKSRKTSVYRGTGVDSIGVHVDSKDGGSEKETCPTEKQCGDYCCQLDNVCKQNAETDEYQCCREDLGHCCSGNQNAYLDYDYSMGPPRPVNSCCDGELYCSARDIEGNCIYSSSCCPKGKTVHGPFERLDGERQYLCCKNEEVSYCVYKASYGCHYFCCNGTVHKEAGLDGADLCCKEGQELICAEHDESDNCLLQTCCYPGQTPYCDTRNSDGRCVYGGCCSGTISKGTSWNGADACIAE